MECHNRFHHNTLTLTVGLSTPLDQLSDLSRFAVLYYLLPACDPVVVKVDLGTVKKKGTRYVSQFSGRLSAMVS